MLPVGLITGFLGSGKTTLLGSLLRQPAMGETAVIVNELGAVAIDHHLLRRVDERTVVMDSGCVCCTMRGDLAEELRDLLSRRERGEIPPFGRVVVETTGLADPAPILYTLLSEPVVRHHYELEAVVTTVDAVNALAQLVRQHEFVKQVVVADRIVVTKTDLVDRPEIAVLVARLRTLNPAAEIFEASFGVVAADALLAPVQRDLREVEAEDAPHDGDVHAFALSFDRAVDWPAFGIWLTMLLQSRGEDVLRVKGLVNVGAPGPVVLNGVQHVVHPPIHLDAWPDDDRTSRIVFIARGLDREALEASIFAFDAVAARSAVA